MKVTSPILPRTMFINLTDSCNLNCPWCGVRKGKNFLPLDTARVSLTWAKRMGAKYAVFVGGEPTLHPHFLALVRFAVDIGLHPLVVTNGVTSMRDEFCEAMKAAGLNGSDVAISFQAVTSIGGKVVLHPGLKRVFERSIKCLKRVGIIPSVNVVITRYVLNYKEMVPYMASLGVSNLQFLTLRTGEGISKDEDLFPRDLREVADYIWHTYLEIRRYNMQMSVGQPPPLCFFSPESAETLSKEWILQTPCGVRDKSQIVITARAKVSVCNFLQHLSNVELNEVLQLQSFDEVIDFVLNSSPRLRNVFQIPHHVCSSCKIWKYCLQSCPLVWRDYSLSSKVTPVNQFIAPLPPWVAYEGGKS